jgi:hypothetical protein
VSDVILNQTNNFISLPEASELTGYHPDYLGFLARTGKLKANKIGRNWVTTKAALDEMKNNINPAEAQAVEPVVPALTQADPNEATKLASLKTEVFSDLAKKIASETVVAAMAATPTNLSHIKAAAEKIHEKDQSAQLQKEVDAKINAMREDFRNEFGRLVDHRIASLPIATDIAAAALTSTAAFASATPTAQAYNAEKFEKTSPTLIFSPIAPLVGKGLGLAASRLNLDKVYKSFEHRFDLQKYFAYALAVLTLVIGGAFLYNNAQNDKKFAALKNDNDSLIVKLAAKQSLSKVGDKDNLNPIQSPITGTQISGTTKTIYLQGKRGPAGAQGPAGVAGIQGSQGNPGTNGLAGTNGTSGANGTNGLSGNYNPGTVVYPPNPTPQNNGTTFASATEVSAVNLNVSNQSNLNNLKVTGPATFASSVSFAGTTAITGPLSVVTTTIPQATLGYDTANNWTAATNATGKTSFTFTGTTPSAVFAPSLDSTAAFNFNNAAGTTTVLTVDTTNGRVGINTTAAPTATLEVAGTTKLGGNVTTTGNLTLTAANPIFDSSSPASTLFINTTTNRPVTFGTGAVTIPNLIVTTSQSNSGTESITSTATTATVFGLNAAQLTSGTLLQGNLTANAGNGQSTTGFQVNLTDSTTAGGGYSAFSVNISGAGTGTGSKTIFDLNPGVTTKEIVFDNAGVLRPVTGGTGTLSTIGSTGFYFKNGFFDTITANNISGTVVGGATSSNTWTVGSTEVGDTNKALIFQRNSGSGNALLQWNAGAGDLRYLSANYPFNNTYTVNNSSIGTTVNLYSGMLTNNTTGGTQKLLSLTNTGTGTTADGIYINNTGTGTTAFEIAGTWTNGIITNNNSINAGSGAITAGTFNGLTLTPLATGFTIAGGTTSKTLTVPLDATVSGTNTGDQTISLTGDVTGSGTGSFATTLATVNANTGAFGSSTAIPNFTVNGKGLITAAGTNAVIAPAGTLTGTTLASNILNSSLTSVGVLTAGSIGGSFGAINIGANTITSGLINGQTISSAANFTGTASFASTVSINNGSPAASAILDIASTTKGFLAPRMTDVQRDAIASPAAGLMIYNTVSNAYNVYNGSTWASIGAGGGSSQWTTSGSNIYYTTGNIGVGTVSPAARIESFNSSATALPASLGATQVASTLRLNSSTSALDFGSSASGAYWMQAANPASLGTNFAILLNPNGGNVGIGNTAPTEALDVQSTLATNLKVKSTGAFTAGITLIPNNNATGFSITATAAASPDLAIKNPSGTDVLHITNAGNVGIGMTNPAYPLQVRVGTNQQVGFRTVNSRIQLEAFNDANNANNTLAVYGNPLLLNPDAGNVGIGTTTPNAKLNVKAASADPVLATYNGLFTLDTSDARTSFQMGVGTTFNGTWLQSYNEPATGGGTFPILLNPIGGNVGIGTTSPGFALTVTGQGFFGKGLRIDDSATSANNYGFLGAAGSWLGSADTNFIVATYQPKLEFATNNSGIKMTLDSSGNLNLLGLAGTGNRCVKADSAGNLVVGASDCSTGGSGADNLGNHIATQNIQLNGFWLSNSGASAGIRVDNSGLVGVGVIPTLGNLQVQGVDGGTAIAVSTAGVGRFALNPIASGGWTLYDHGTGSFVAGISQVSGNVGIGTMTPNTNNGSAEATALTVTASSGHAGIELASSQTVDGSSIGDLNYINNSSPDADKRVGILRFSRNGGANNSTSFDLYTKNAGSFVQAITVLPAGNVGIGIAVPLDKLHVMGTPSFGLGIDSPLSSNNSYLNFRQAGVIKNQIITAATTGDLNFWVNNGGTDAMTILQTNGNIGIGTSAPSYLLQVQKDQNSATFITAGNATNGTGSRSGFYATNSSSTGVSLTVTSAAYTGVASWANRGLLVTDSTIGGVTIGAAGASADIHFETGGTGLGQERMRIDNTGKVGIGTTTPAAYLHIKGVNIGGRGQLSLEGSDFAQLSLYKDATTQTGALYQTQSTGVLNLLNSVSGADVNVNLTGTANFTVQNILLVSSAAPANSLVVNSAGNVGLGTSDPTTGVLRVAVPFAKTNTATHNLAYFGSNEVLASNPFGLNISVTGAAAIANRFVKLETGDYGLAADGNLSLQPSGGRVGIGTTNPSQLLDVAGKVNISLANPDVNAITLTATTGTNAAGIKISNTGGNYFLGVATSAGTRLGSSGLPYSFQMLTESAQALQFGTNNAVAMTILPNGNVGIGTTAPTNNLDISAAASSTAQIGINAPTAGWGSTIAFKNGGVTKWALGNNAVTSSNNFELYNSALAATSFTVDTSNNFIVNSLAGTGNRCVKATSTGTLSVSATDCSTGGSGADNLGNHIATQNVQLNNFWLSNNGTSNGIRVTNGGNVGVGVAAPAYPFQVQSGATGALTPVASFRDSSTNANELALRTGTGRADILATWEGTGINTDLTFTPTTAAGVQNEAMRIQASTGNVGIGTTNPSTLLHLKGSTAKLRLQDTGANGSSIDLLADNNMAYVIANYVTSAIPLTFLTGAAERMRIDTAGNVGIGTTAPVTTFDILGPSRIAQDWGLMSLRTSDAFAIDKGPTISLAGKFDTAGVGYIDFGAIAGRKENSTDGNKAGYLSLSTLTSGVGSGATEKLRITSTGQVGIGTTAPNRAGLSAADATVLSLESKTSSGGSVLELLAPGIATGNEIGRLYFGRTASSGGAVTGKALITANSVNGNDATNLGFYTQVAGGALTSRMLIDSTGNIGIGTATPVNGAGGLFKLTVLGANSSLAAFATSDFVQNTSGSGLFIATGANTGNSYTNIQAFNTGAGAVGVLALNANGGNVGIGTTNPLAKLDVGGAGVQSSPLIGARGTANALEWGHGNSAGYGSTLGYYLSAGNPYLAFNGEAGTTINTFKTRGIKSSIILSDVAGGIQLGTVASVSADNQLFSPNATFLAGGSVGIGTTTPGAKLDIVDPLSSGAVNFKVQDSSGYGLYVSGENTLNFNYGVNASSAGWINYTGYNNGTTQFRDLNIANGKTGSIASFIGTTGNVGIGTTAPTDSASFTKALDIQGTGGSAAYFRASGTSPATQYFAVGYSPTAAYLIQTSNAPIYFYTNNILHMSLDASGVLNLAGLAGTGNRCLKADSAGNIVAGSTDCSTGGSGADNLGNHIATQNIQLNGFWLSNNGSSNGIRVSNAGEVGIGAAPLAGVPLSLVAAGDAFEKISTTGGSYSYLQLNTPSSGDGYLLKNVATGNAALDKSLYLYNSNGPIQFVPNATIANAVTISTAGYLGLGTTSPGMLLDAFLSSGSGRQNVGNFLAGSNVAGNGASIRLGSTTTVAGYISGIETTGNEGDLVFGTQSAGSYSEKVRILGNNGNVGIGTANPGRRLEVFVAPGDTSTPVARFYAPSTAYASGVVDIGSETSGATYSLLNVRYGAGMPNTAFRVNGDGNVGVGTPSPAYPLDVVGIANIQSPASPTLNLTAGGGNASLINDVNANGLWFKQAGVVKMAINSSGNVGIGTTTPNFTGYSVNERVLTVHSATGIGVIELSSAQAVANSVTNSDVAFANSNMTGEKRLAMIRSSIKGAAANNMGGQLDFYTKADGGALASALTIANSGNVGLGTTAPLARLDLGIQTPGINTAVTYDVARAGNANYALSTGAIYDATSVDQYLMFNGQLTGGTKAAPTFTGGTFGGYYLKTANTGTTPGRFDIGYINGSGAGQAANNVLSLNGASVGIGTTNPGAKLEIAPPSTTTYALKVTGTVNAYATYALGNGTTGQSYGSVIQAGTNSSDVALDIQNFAGTSMMRVRGDGSVGIGTVAPAAILQIAGQTAVNTPVLSVAGVASATSGSAYAAKISSQIFSTSGTGTLTDATGLNVALTTNASAFTTSSIYDLHVADVSKGAGSAVTNQYGLYVDSLTAGSSNNYAIYTAGTTQSYFGGNVGIGTTSPSYILSLGGDVARTIGMNQSTSGTPPSLTVKSADAAAGTNNWSSDLLFATGAGTGNSAGQTTGNIIFQTSAPGNSGATVQTLTERMRIAPSGNVEIGSTGLTGARLSVDSSDNIALSNNYFWNDHSAGITLRNSSNTVNTGSPIWFLMGSANNSVAGISGIQEGSTLGALGFYTGGSGRLSTIPERMRIDSSGNVAIGTTSLGGWASALQVASAYTDIGSNSQGAMVNIFSSSAAAIDKGGTLEFGGNTGNGVPSYGFAGIKGAKQTAAGDADYRGYLALYTTGSSGSSPERMRIDGSGNILVGTTNSDIGGSVSGIRLDPAGHIATSSSDTGISSSPLSVDRRGTNNTGSELTMAMGGFIKAQLGVLGTNASTDDGGFTFSTVYANATVSERMRIAANGVIGINSTRGVAKLVVDSDLQAFTGLDMRDTNATLNGAYQVFENSAGGQAGLITHSGTSAVSYLTTSDQRLKLDQGVTTNTSVLQGVVVHDFKWRADGSLDRGVFAQEAYLVKPSAVYVGSNKTDANGNLTNPWAVDYSKFVPDLIVGWQAHEADLKLTVKNSAEFTSTSSYSVAMVVVSNDNKNISTTSSDYDPNLLGVVEGGASGKYKVATAGTANILVTDENGAVKVGDLLTTSASIPGYAMKAVHSGKILGSSLVSFDPSVGSSTMQTQVVNGVTIHSDFISADIHVAYANINNTFVMGHDATVAQTVNQATTQTGSLGSVNFALTYVIRQAVKAGDNTVADILQVQSGKVTRLMVAQNGATTINATVVPSDTDNIFVIRNNDTDKFVINSKGDAIFKGSLYLNGKLYVTDKNVAGAVVTDTLGKAKVTFTEALPFQPIVNVTPVAGTNPVFATIESFDYDSAGNILAVNLDAFNAGGTPASAIKLNYLVVISNSNVDHAYSAPAGAAASAAVAPASAPAPAAAPVVAPVTTTPVAPVTTAPTSIPPAAVAPSTTPVVAPAPAPVSPAPTTPAPDTTVTPTVAPVVAPTPVTTVQ